MKACHSEKQQRLRLKCRCSFNPATSISFSRSESFIFCGRGNFHKKSSHSSIPNRAPVFVSNRTLISRKPIPTGSHSQTAFLSPLEFGRTEQKCAQVGAIAGCSLRFGLNNGVGCRRNIGIEKRFGHRVNARGTKGVLRERHVADSTRRKAKREIEARHERAGRNPLF